VIQWAIVSYRVFKDAVVDVYAQIFTPAGRQNCGVKDTKRWVRGELRCLSLIVRGAVAVQTTVVRT